MKIYTKTGDKGSTSLYGGVKVSKAHIRIDAYGTTDELNSNIGVIASHNSNKQVKEQLLKIQENIFVLGSELATPKEKLYLANGKSRIGQMIQESDIETLESWIDEWEKQLDPLTHFILPGGGKASASAHLARTVCRRAERIVVALAENEEIRQELQKYLNRLSDYFFVLARVLAKMDNEPEVLWLPSKD
ncbi:cob(I)yrinic acid a,c-diamide adenosyltransferase [Weeksellaceae bacterium KMM 9713]|uniref:Corrinoid adenosyltransferase n=1 Tax=Profundicola chukchiensis TaxID=2961959 RepID=A0A9X4MYZ1_9FLAO|nr:cob(I)yrinic acid a,c-diamide adenosyltransferase [Profundicola chukchiensis]MDG4944906.1 cob(I)yrinic acid a,c-diamide adenosyltransferase [Profundicola chukchiensis]